MEKIVKGKKQLMKEVSESYHTYVHRWLKLNFGKANTCEVCGGVESKRYEWALKNGCIYEKKRDSFWQLCKKCHIAYDDVKNKRRYAVEQYSILGEFIKRYDSIIQAASAIGISRGNISHVLSGKAHSTGGYIWKYAPEGIKEKKQRDERRYITFNGITKTIREWSLHLGGSQNLIQNRLFRLKWSVEKSLTTPVAKK